MEVVVIGHGLVYQHRTLLVSQNCEPSEDSDIIGHGTSAQKQKHPMSFCKIWLCSQDREYTHHDHISPIAHKNWKEDHRPWSLGHCQLSFWVSFIFVTLSSTCSNVSDSMACRLWSFSSLPLSVDESSSKSLSTLEFVLTSSVHVGLAVSLNLCTVSHIDYHSDVSLCIIDKILVPVLETVASFTLTNNKWSPPK